MPSYSTKQLPSKAYTTRWNRIAAFWAVLAIASAVLQFSALINPEWLVRPELGAYFGLYNYCATRGCHFDGLFTVNIVSTGFSVAALLMLIATISSILAALSILILLLANDRYVFLLCAWMQTFSWFTTLLACLIFPFGWAHAQVHEICHSQSYNFGACRLGSAYLLAALLCADHLSLSALAFLIAAKQPPPLMLGSDCVQLYSVPQISGSSSGKTTATMHPISYQSQRSFSTDGGCSMILPL